MRAPNIAADDVKKILKDYKLSDIKLIGQGGQKTVFKCKLEDSSVFALKILEIEEPQNELFSFTENNLVTEEIKDEVLARAEREIAIMTKCNSPHLVKLGPIGLEFANYHGKKLIYFSEEYIDGENLLDLLKTNGLFTISEAINLAIDITMAIKELWNIHMVHRDIKPNNIMKRKSGEYVLLDTGIAYDTQGTQLTKTFNQVGTPLFKSPEQIRGIKSELDFRSDLFLLGIVIYFVLTGSHPFANKKTTRDQLTYNILNLTPQPPRSLNPKIPQEFSDLIMRLLAKHAHLRFRSCDDLLDQLQSLKVELL